MRQAEGDRWSLFETFHSYSGPSRHHGLLWQSFVSAYKPRSKSFDQVLAEGLLNLSRRKSVDTGNNG